MCCCDDAPLIVSIAEYYIIMDQSEWNGFTLLEDGSLQLKGFNVRLDFKDSLQTRILKDAVDGLDGVLSSTAELFSLVLGDDFQVKYSSVENVQAGSCTFKDISVVLEKSKNLFDVVRHMDSKKILIICATGITWYALHGIFGYLEERNRVEASGANENCTISVQDSIIMVGNDLRRRFPDDETEVNHVLACLAQLVESKPKVLRKAAGGLTKLAHPGGIDADGIVAGSTDGTGQSKEFQLLNHDEVQSVPQKLPALPSEEPQQELINNVQIEVIKIDKESKSDSALICRILDENYSQKKCPLIIHDAGMRQEVMNRFPKNIFVNLYALKKRTTKGEMILKGYVLKDILQ